MSIKKIFQNISDFMSADIVEKELVEYSQTEIFAINMLNQALNILRSINNENAQKSVKSITGSCYDLTYIQNLTFRRVNGWVSVGVNKNEVEFRPKSGQFDVVVTVDGHEFWLYQKHRVHFANEIKPGVNELYNQISRIRSLHRELARLAIMEKMERSSQACTTVDV